MTYGRQSTNGFLLSVIHFAASQFGWKLDYIQEDASLLELLLLMRQHVYTHSEHKGFTLLDQERLDEAANVPWEELVRRNREELARQMGI